MFNNIRTKLTVTYLVLILAVMVLTSFFLLNILEQYYLTYQSEAMIRAANLVAEFSAGYLRDTPDVVAISDLAEDFARQISARVIITDHRRRVVGDSLRVGGLVGSTLDRDEVAAALNGETGQSIQYSQASERWVLQVAVPVHREGQVLGSVFISASLNLIYRQVLPDIRRFLLAATVLSMMLAGFLGVIFAHRLTVPIESLTKATEQMARGDLSQRVRVRSRDEIGRLADQFNIMASRLQEMTRQLREFVANASHELRTPLTSLNILVKSLREYPLNAEEREEFLADMDAELERLIHLVENLLDLTRLDRLAAEDTFYSADFVAIIDGTLDIMQKRAEQKGVAIRCELPEKALVQAVPHQLKQVVFNLVDNAIKYTPPGSEIRVTLGQAQDQLVLSVADTGPGVPEEHREKIFERFYRVDKARSREQGGTGLGLAIVREIVRRHGGKVWVEETPGGGATFIVTLPRVPVVEAVVNKN